MSYDYKIAKDVLSENDKNRLVCLYLSNAQAINSSVDWDKATAMFDCASVDSMRVMARTVLKKIEKAGGKEGVDAGPEKGKAAGGGGKKRKGKGGESGHGNEDDAEESPKKKGKGGGGRKKEAATPVADDDEAEAADVGVKQEENDELS